MSTDLTEHERIPVRADLSGDEPHVDVILRLSADSVLAYISDPVIGKWVRNLDTLMVPAGQEHVSFSAPGYTDRSSRISMRNQDIGTIRVQMLTERFFSSRSAQRVAWKVHSTEKNLVVFTEPENVLTVNGEVQDGGFFAERFTGGHQHIEVHHPRKGTRTVMVDSDFAKMDYHPLWMQPTFGEYVKLVSVPGMYHYDRGDRVRGTLFAGGTAATAATAVIFHGQRISRRRDYRVATEQFRANPNPSPESLSNIRNKYHTSRNLARFFTGASVAIYLTSWIDAAGMFGFEFTPKSERIDPFAGFDSESGTPTAGINVRF
ncbi:MAG: hypothetical protein LAT57_01425 [Balneolales bacterium]|nr:hypothetical protein [Balneolales bacterium]